MKCPPVGKTVELLIVDIEGKPVKAAYIESTNTRTGKKGTNLQRNIGFIAPPGWYKLFAGAVSFSPEGDKVNVLVRVESGKEFMLSYVIKGGVCPCDLEKISGPETLVVD